MPNNNKKHKPFWLIYFLGFLWAFSYALPLYSQSSFIESIVGRDNISLVFLVLSFVGLVSIYYYEVILKRFGNYKSAVGMIICNLLMVIGLMFANGILALVFFIFIFTSFSLFVINNDIFLETISDNKNTGRIRTTMLTIGNIGILIAPFLMGYLIGDTNKYELVFLIGGIVFFPALILLLYNRQAVEDSKMVYRKRSLKSLEKLLQAHPDILRIMSTEFALRFFYAIMVFYLPIILHDYVGFHWSVIGIILTIMLLPFILLELPAGRVADKYLGEKEMLITGLVLMAVFSVAVGVFTVKSAMIWGVILFMTRMGAALVESMNETYFFKQIDNQDMDLIDIFRDVRPFAWLLAAGISWLFLRWFDIPQVFFLLAIVILISLYPATRIHDTK